jgi:hypothetical protein
VLVARHVGLIHHVFDVVHLHDLWNHHEPEDLHDVAENLDPTVCAGHLQMDGAHQSELDAPLVLSY